jgi:hypothetical protein
MMKNVKNNDNPTITWFGGICWVASAVLTKERTTTILVKHVIKIKMLGAKERTVRSKSNLTDVETFSGELLLKNSIT